MSGDEKVMLAVSALLSLVLWGAWYIVPFRVRRIGRHGTGRRLLFSTPVIAAALLYLVLRTASAHDVRDDPNYLVFYLLLGAAWVGFWIRSLAVTGISTRDDVVERRNESAAYAVAGAILAITLCYAGGNIGDGPGWWVVVFSAVLSTVALFAAWLLLEVVTDVSEVVTVDRDTSAGVRLAGFLVACGLMLGRAVAGDWVSADATVRDFIQAGWPVVALLILAAIVERALRPTPDHPRPAVVPYGLMPAMAYLFGAVYMVMRLGLPA